MPEATSIPRFMVKASVLAQTETGSAAVASVRIVVSQPYVAPLGLWR
jgi:hypothetical protein